ncbi:MAG: amylo-alpha-1,6-glucosidase [Candidatus Altiarchaeota archaeon]
MRVKPNALGFPAASELEWLLSNGIGGYSSSTVMELNTRKYHGLLVSSLENLRRMVCLQKMEDALYVGSQRVELHCVEFGGSIVSPGLEKLVGFEKGRDYVIFTYEGDGFRLDKRVKIASGKNEIMVSYALSNRSGERIRHVVSPHISFRSIHELLREGEKNFEVNADGMNASVSVGGHKLMFRASEGDFNSLNLWMRNIYYRQEAGRGYPAVDESLIPFTYSADVSPDSTCSYVIAVGLDGLESKLAYGQPGKRTKESVLDVLGSAADSFVIDAGSRMTVVAGYHWFGEWGRDAMISLPGLTLVRGRIDDARLILEHFLGRVHDGRIMTESESGTPVYRDYDSSLWLFDSIMQYIKYAGPDMGRELLRKHWARLSDLMQYYSSISENGLIMHDSGTWMDTLRRDDAVEVQALWYNALKAFEKFSTLAQLDNTLPTAEIIGDFESTFLREYWNGSHLMDCIGVDSFRPNQLMALSLDYTCVDKSRAKSILSAVEKRLLTPFGLRTLSSDDSSYCGSYSGGVRQREEAYHNGTVWPWLLGPYVRASVRYGGKAASRRARKLLEDFFDRALSVGALGSINEIFDGDAPHLPRGCISQAWSVAEPLRAYLEDALGRRPPYEK